MAEPTNIIDLFTALARIPRPSGHEEAVSAYLCQWAQDHGLSWKTDAHGQVLVDRPAAPGLENAPMVILQAHMDMVCVSEDGVAYDPLHDPILLDFQGDTLTAKGTSLGADDGIGVAIAQYMLQDSSLRTGPLRAIFTTNEEQKMDAVDIPAEWLDAPYLINLDWEAFGSVCSSCAGADTYRFSCVPQWIPVTPDMQPFQLSLSGLAGGHSGTEIHLGHPNALCTLAQCLVTLQQAGIDTALTQFQGGQAVNAIPAYASLTFLVPGTCAERAQEILRAYIDTFQAEYAHSEPGCTFTLHSPEMPQYMIAPADTARFTQLMVCLPQEVFSMSPSVPGLVESSANIGLLQASDNTLSLDVLARSSRHIRFTQLRQVYTALSAAFGFTLEHLGSTPAWPVRPDSVLLRLCQKAYLGQTGEEIRVEPVHAGVECGAFALKNPDLDMISLGPTLYDVHTPMESCYLPHVEQTAQLVRAILDATAHGETA